MPPPRYSLDKAANSWTQPLERTPLTLQTGLRASYEPKVKAVFVWLLTVNCALCSIDGPLDPQRFGMLNHDPSLSAQLAEEIELGSRREVENFLELGHCVNLAATVEDVDPLLLRDHGIAVVAGVFEPGPGDRVYNTAVAFDAHGDLVAAYRKIHLFDALGQRESDKVAPGDEVVIAEIGGLRIGILICYDIRFPEHARALVARGADLVVVPACWAAGLFKEEHWVTLVRARAIENTVWVAAADQVPDRSEPPSRAPTGSGRSMLIDPMGVVRLDLGPRAGVAVGDADTAVTAEISSSEAHAAIATLRHRREDVFGRP